MKIGIVGKNRYIDVDKFAEAICNFQQIDEDAANAMIWLLRTFHAADVEEVRHGEWREVNDKYPRYVCTVCNHLFNNKNYNYCPCCGAKMDGERSENETKQR